MLLALVTTVKDQTSADISVLSAEILDYLHAHPETADTIDGVVNWWLVRQRYTRNLAQVKSALDLLINQGVVESLQNPDGNVVYRLAKVRQ